MSGQLGELVVSISANLARFTEATTKAQYQSQKMAEKIGRDVSNVSGHFDRMGANVRRAIAGMVGTGALALFAKDLIDTSAKIDKFRNALTYATGSARQGAAEFDFIRSEAVDLGLDLERATEGFVKIAAAARGTELEGQGARDIFKSVSEAASVLGMSSYETEGALLAISQMISKGTVQAEELRGQLGERLPGAFQIAARAMGVTTAELDNMLKKGEVIASDFLPKFSAEMHRAFGEQASKVESTQKEINKLNTAIFDLKSTIIEGGGSDALRSLISGMSEVVGFTKEMIRYTREATVYWASFFDKIHAVTSKVSWKTGLGPLLFSNTREQIKKEWANIDAGAMAAMKDIAAEFNKKTIPLPISSKGIAKTSPIRTNPPILKTSSAKSTKPKADAFVMENELALWSKKMAESWKKDREQADEDAKWIYDQRNKYAAAIGEMITQENAFQEAVIRRSISLSESAQAFGQITKFDAITQQIDLYNDLMANLEAKQGLIKAQSIEWMNVQTEIDNTNAKLTELGLSLREQTGTISEGVNEGLRLYIESAYTAFQNGQKLAEETARNMEQAFSDLFFETVTGDFEDLGDTIVNFLENILRSVTDVLGQMATKGIMTGIKGMFGGGIDYSWLESAHGNVFSGAGISAYSNSIVSRPTVFPFAHGIGLMGENGDEAILPLTRIGGDLGVKAATGETNIEVVLNVENKTGSQVKATDGGGQFDGKRWVRNITLELLQTDPGFRGALKGLS